MIILICKHIKAYINNYFAKPKAALILLLIAALTIVSILAGCADNNKQQHQRTKQDDEKSMDEVSLKLVANKKTAPETVELSLNIKNNSNKPIKASYSSTKKFDFTVKNSAGEEIWHWSRGQMFAQILSEETLAAGKSLKFSANWPKINDAGAKVKPGKYIIYGRWQAKGYNKVVKSSVEI